jgi:DNA-binding transcriptional ArsR family regulator
MDTFSTVEVARELGVPLPRLLRFVSGKDGVVRVGNRIGLSAAVVGMARDRFGVIPKVPGLTRVEVQALVALSRHPRGLVSVRQVAKASRLSPTAASRAVSKLMTKGLVARHPTPVFDGKVETKDVLEVDWLSPSWREVAPLLSKAELPKAKAPTTLGRRLPPRLAEVFWTGDWRKVDPSKSPRYVAQRILNEGLDNPEALAFLGNLPREAVSSAVAHMAQARP